MSFEYKMAKYQIILVDDDYDEFIFIKEAIEENNIACGIAYCNSGLEFLNYIASMETINEEFIDYYLILLDLNMPGETGQEILKKIKSIEKISRIPVIVYTSSEDVSDIASCYTLGAASYILKPIGWSEMMKTIAVITDYWMQIVKLPGMECMTGSDQHNRISNANENDINNLQC